MQDFFVHLSNSWGLSDKPGFQDMWINNNGSYLVKLEYAKPKDKSENKERNGKIEESKMDSLKNFLENNVSNDSNNTIHDASYEIEWKMGEKTIKVTNNMDLWKKTIELIPEYRGSDSR